MLRYDVVPNFLWANIWFIITLCTDYILPSLHAHRINVCFYEIQTNRAIWNRFTLATAVFSQVAVFTLHAFKPAHFYTTLSKTNVLTTSAVIYGIKRYKRCKSPYHVVPVVLTDKYIIGDQFRFVIIDVLDHNVHFNKWLQTYRRQDTKQ